MQIPNRRVHKMIAELREVAEIVKPVDYPSAFKLEGMAFYLENNFKSRPTKKESSVTGSS